MNLSDELEEGILFLITFKFLLLSSKFLDELISKKAKVSPNTSLLLNIVDRLDEMKSSFDNRLDRMDQRLDRMDQRFDQIENRLDRMDQRFDQIDNRLDRMDQRLIIVEQHQHVEDHRSVSNLSSEFLIISNIYSILDILF